jgi:uncharacterized protein YndB with AHSA1/START domain
MSEQVTKGTSAASGLAPVRRDVTVEAPAERAFSVFVERQSAWWPADYHIGEQAPEAIVVEPHQGGRWFERAPDGRECDWGRVLAWEPPNRIVLSWQINAEWQFDPDEAKGSEVEVTFTPSGPSSTHVQLEHRNFERHGAGAPTVRESIAGEGGWAGILARFAKEA